jgi:putative DNA primase/helicase
MPSADWENGTDVEISVFSKANNKSPSNVTSIRDFMNGIEDATYAISVANVRAELARVNGLDLSDDERKSLVNASKQKHLPAVSISGRVTKGGRKTAFDDGRFRHSGWLQIDIDKKDLGGRSPCEVRDLLGKDEHVLKSTLSPTGEGVKAFMRIPICQTPEEHKAAFAAAENHIRERYGLRIDGQTKDPVRLCYATHDPESSWNPAPVTLPVPEPQLAVQSLAAPVRGNQLNRRWDMSLEDLRGMLAVIPPSPDYDEWLRIASAAWSEFGDAATPALKEWSPEVKPGEYAYKFLHRLTEYTMGTLVMIAKNHGWIQRSPFQTSGPQTIYAADLLRFHSTDAGNAERLHAVHGANIRHVSTSGQWIVWNDQRWEPDTSGAITRMFISVMRQTARQAADHPEPTIGAAIAKHALKSNNKGPVEAGIVLAKSLAGISISVNDLDADPWLVGTPGGVIDLREGKPITPRRDMLITKSIGTKFDPDATCPIWERFLQTVTDGDQDLIDYLQSAVGYTLAGVVKEQCLFFLHGSGQNGKGVFSETIKHLGGDYAQTAPESLFVKDRNQSIPNDIARLAGCRLVIAAELEEGAAFAESRIKSLTGGDSITARFLHREFFDFPPTHKFWISGNHKPTVKGTDLGIWRRIRLLPFTVRIPDDQKDPNLGDKLLGELPGILNWALAGCLRWQREGLRTPRCVDQATADYRSEEDIIGQFLDDKTTVTPTARVLQTDLFGSYRAWATISGFMHPLAAKSFNRKIAERDIRAVKTRGVRFWQGISLKK